MSLAAFRATSRAALRTLPRWTAPRTAAGLQRTAPRRAQSSSASSLEGQQSVRRESTSATSATAGSGAQTRGVVDADAAQKLLSSHLREADPAVFDIIEKEKKRQKHSINLIPSENFTSQAVLDALGSVMQSARPHAPTSTRPPPPQSKERRGRGRRRRRRRAQRSSTVTIGGKGELTWSFSSIIQIPKSP
jgi:hypothetical protein